MEVPEHGHAVVLNIMVPFPLSKRQNAYLIVVVDYFTKWVEMFSLKDVKTQKLVKILREEIFTRSGAPKYLISH